MPSDKAKGIVGDALYIELKEKFHVEEYTIKHYLIKVLKAWEQAGRPAPGVYEVDVLHDGWCSMLKGKPDCNCDPDIDIRVKHADE